MKRIKTVKTFITSVGNVPLMKYSRAHTHTHTHAHTHCCCCCCCRLQGRLNRTSNESAIWRTFGEHDVIVSNVTRYSYVLHNVDPYSQYEFRVVPYWLDFGKPIPGIPSNASLPITPIFLYLGIRYFCNITVFIFIKEVMLFALLFVCPSV